MSSLENHQYHELERSRANKNYYRCMHPECSYYQNRTRLEGKRALCHKCKEPFILSWQQLRNKYPVCDFCTKSPKAEQLRKLREVTEGIVSPNEEQEGLPPELKEILNIHSGNEVR
jgi:hypothetical protein